MSLWNSGDDDGSTVMSLLSRTAEAQGLSLRQAEVSMLCSRARLGRIGNVIQGRKVVTMFEGWQWETDMVVVRQVSAINQRWYTPSALQVPSYRAVNQVLAN